MCENEGRIELFRVTFSPPLSPNARTQLAAWRYSGNQSVTCADKACKDAVPRVVERMYTEFVDSIKPLLLLQVGATSARRAAAARAAAMQARSRCNC